MKINHLLLVAGVLAVLMAVRLFTFYSNLEEYPSGAIINFESQLLNEPKLNISGQTFTVMMPNSQRVFIKSGVDPFLSYQDRVVIEGKLEYFEAENGNQIPMLSYPQIKLIQKGIEANFVNKVREKLIKFFNANLGQVNSALMLGITFGIKQDMPKEFEANLQESGLMHVIAASGMNITLVGGFLLALFTLFLSRKLALIFSITGIIFYTALAGFEPSIVRAAIMGIVVFTAQFLGRQSTAAVGLFGAGFVMLFISPSLLYDIGFQLSFLATAGLVYVRPLFLLNTKVKKITEKSIIGEDIVTTLTAQIATIPILIVNFGSYSMVSLLVNALLLWTVPILMIIGGISGVIGLVFEPIGSIILYFSLPFLLYFTKVTEFFGNIHAQIEVKSVPILLIYGYYLVLLSIILHYRKRQ